MMSLSFDVTDNQLQDTAEAPREIMLDTALKAFADKGFQAASIREIADLAGVSHGLFRKYFGNKEELWKAAIDFGVNRYAIAMKKQADRSRGLVPTIQDLIRVMLTVTVDHPALVRIMVVEGTVRSERSDYIAEIWHDVGDQYRNLFYNAQSNGELTAFVDSDMFLFVLTSGMVPLALPGLANSILGGDIAGDNALTEHTERLIRVLFPNHPDS